MKKTIVEINSSTVGSTGRIMFMIAECARNRGYTVYTASAEHGNEKKIVSPSHMYVGNIYDKKIHVIMSTYTGYNGCFSHLMTYLFLKKIDKINPDIMHFHNLHNSFINLKMLFQYVKKKGIPVVWTLHDCWSFTGHCPYFDFANCQKWKIGCDSCSQLMEYPFSKRDTTAIMYENKKKWFTGANVTLVTPSDWLAREVKKSFLCEYPVRVINNGINLDIFKPTASQFREKYNLKNKILILGVAAVWAPRKGLDVFIQLAKDLPPAYQVIVVGVSEAQKNIIPTNVLAITRTNNQKEMVEIYSATDIFVNPTREDNFPTTNLEALACGTCVITYNTGGSPEAIDESCGVVVEKDDYYALKERILSWKPGDFRMEDCMRRASNYSMKEKYDEYISLYDEILHGLKEAPVK